MDTKTISESFLNAFGRDLPAVSDSFDEFIGMAKSGELQRRIGDTHVIEIYGENDSWELQKNLIPFMWVQQPNHVDYYCYKLNPNNKPDCAIEVFAVHTSVHGWPNFQSFLQWLKIQ